MTTTTSTANRMTALRGWADVFLSRLRISSYWVVVVLVEAELVPLAVGIPTTWRYVFTLELPPVRPWASGIAIVSVISTARGGPRGVPLAAVTCVPSQLSCHVVPSQYRKFTP